MPEALVFDYDGVLADTEVLHWKSWAALLQRHGVPLTWEDYCKIGRGIDDAKMRETLRLQMPSLDVAELARQNAERKSMVREWTRSQSPIPRETIDLLATLGAYRVGLVTTS